MGGAGVWVWGQDKSTGVSRYSWDKNVSTPRGAPALSKNKIMLFSNVTSVNTTRRAKEVRMHETGPEQEK